MIIEILILDSYKQGFKTIIETEFFNYASNELFFQYSKDILLYLVTFFIKNVNYLQCHYIIYDKKWIPIILYLEQCWPRFEVSDISIKVITNYKDLEYFITTK